MSYPSQPLVRQKSGRCEVIVLVATILCGSVSTKVLADGLAAKEAAGVDPPRLADASRNAPVHAGDTSPSTQQRIQDLIRELGNPRYTSRRAAANELRQIGAEAFDLLHAATDDADPEVAASARYLLRQISVRWVQSDDPAAVRVILRDFGRESESARLESIEQLAELTDGAGVAGLCRIARFDRAPLVSRMAALAIIRPVERPAAHTPIDPHVVEHELGGSTRAAATWLRQYLAQLRDLAASVPAWQRLVDEETKRLEQNAGETSAAIVVGLLWNLGDVYRQLGDNQAVVGVIDRMIAVNQESLDDTAVGLLSWLIENQSWPVVDAFLDKHLPRLEQSKRPLYYAALARARQGKSDVAEELADKASQLDPQATRESFYTAKDLEERGQFEWAVREYRRAIDQQSVDSLEAILARIALASLLHDYERHADAAEALDPLFKALNGEGPLAKQYAEIQQYLARRGSALPELKILAARLHYYRGCQYREEKDWQRARESLETAINSDPTDADVLIAMYRLPESDDAWREKTRQWIRDLANELQQKIDESPTDASPYNQWAWLISNTEGDFQKAIRYSHRSLELNDNGDSGAASFLDTLGRCYYAAGDYQNALKYQRLAVEKVGYMQVMQRQLALFEKTLAEKQGAGSGEQTEKTN